MNTHSDKKKAKTNGNTSTSCKRLMLKASYIMIFFSLLATAFTAEGKSLKELWHSMPDSLARHSTETYVLR